MLNLVNNLSHELFNCNHEDSEENFKECLRMLDEINEIAISIHGEYVNLRERKERVN